MKFKNLRTLMKMREIYVKMVGGQPKVYIQQGAAEKPNTFVTVLGWAGAADKNVAKYSAVYNDKGFTTVQFTSSAAIVPGWGTKNSREVSSLATVLESILNKDSNRLVIHLFSMNGFLTLCALCLQYPELKVLSRCDGLFIDSAPIHSVDFGWKNIKGHAAAMNHIFSGIKVEKNSITTCAYGVIKLLHTMRFAFTCLMDNTMVRIGMITQESVSPFHFILNNPNLPSVVSLVFSDADVLCWADHIQQFKDGIENRTDKDNRIVLSTRNKDSQHVEHFRKYPKQYLEQIEDFIKKVENVQNEQLRNKL